MPETAARLLRLLVADHMRLRPKRGTWLERLAKLAASNNPTAHYEHGWKLEAA
jgi:hypothetical protein